MSTTLVFKSDGFDMKYIYDIFHNDNNKLVIIMPAEFKPPSIEYLHNGLKSNFHLHICPHGHTFIYELLVKTIYVENVKLIINNKVFDKKVNKYPEFNNEIIMSTMVKYDDNYIKQWIDFHYNIGVKHFIIYDNKKSDNMETGCNKILNGDALRDVSNHSNLELLLDDYIKSNIVVLIDWPYNKFMKKSGISGQTTQQNHSIYAFRNSKYIGLFDIDEYVNMQNNTNISNFFDSMIEKLKLDTNNIGSFRILNKFFHNPYNLPTHDFNFLSIFDCQTISMRGQEKNFVIPKNVNTFSVHMITNGKNMYEVNCQELYFNHYCFLNKATRGRSKCHLKDKTILKHCNFFKK